MSYFGLLNLLFEAHRNRDLVNEKVISDMLAEIEPEYADTLDAIDY